MAKRLIALFIQTAMLAALLSTGSGTAFAHDKDEDVVSQGCSELAHARNDAFRALHKSWKQWRGELRTLERDAKVALKAADKAADKANSKKLELLVDTTKDSVEELLDAAADEISDLRHDAKHALNDLFDGSVCGDGDDELDEDDVKAVTTNADAALPTAAAFMKIATDADKAMEAVINGGASTGTAGTASTSKGLDAEVTALLANLKKELAAVTTEKKDNANKDKNSGKNKVKAQADDSGDSDGSDD